MQCGFLERINVLSYIFSNILIVFHRFERPDKTRLNLFPGVRPEGVNGYLYSGAGLEAGQCGVAIENVQPNDDGVFGCFLGIAGNEVRGNITVTVASK